MDGGWTRRAAFGLAAGLAAPRLALASRASVRLNLLVGARPGSDADRWARGFAPFLERHWPRSAVTVANIPGKGGLVAARALASSEPDGRTIGLVAVPTLLARAIENGDESLLERLQFVAAVVQEYPVLLAGPDTDFASLAGTGRWGLIGCPPPGSAAQLAAAGLQEMLPLTQLAFPNAAAARQAVLAGNLAAAVLPLPEALQSLQDGRLRGIALAAEQRSPLTPEIPTFAELGMPSAMPGQRGPALPRGAPQDMQEALASALRALADDPEFADQTAANGYAPGPADGAVWDTEIRAQFGRLRRLWEEDPWSPRKG